MMLLARLFLLSITQVAAQPSGSSRACTYVEGCITGEEAVMNMLTAIVIGVGEILVAIAGGASVLFVVIGGVQMMTAFGDDGKFQTGIQNTIYSLVGFAIVLGSQVIVGFVDRATRSSPEGNPVVALMSGAVNAILALFNVVFVTIIIFAGLKMIIGRGQSDEFAGGKKALGYAIMGAIIINVAVSISRAVLNAFS